MDGRGMKRKILLRRSTLIRNMLYTPVYSVRVESRLGFSLAIFGWFLHDTHELYCELKRSLCYITAPSLCKAIRSFSVCPGLPEVLNAVDPIDSFKCS